MQTHLAQIDPNRVIDAAVGVGQGNALGYLILVLSFVIAGLAWLVRYLFKKNEQAQEKRESSLEKAYDIMASQNKHSENLENVLSEMRTKQEVHGSYLQQILSK